MTVIFRGRRYLVADHAATDGGCLELTIQADRATRVLMSRDDADLILSPTAEDLHVAEAFERGEIRAFEYADGHTYPPNREIPPKRHTPARTH